MIDNNNKEILKGYLFDYIQGVTTRARHDKEPSDLFNRPSHYICPFCNSGTGEHGTGGFTFYPDENTYYCFACGESGDIFSLHAKLNDLSLNDDFPQIIDDLEKKYGLYSPKQTVQKPKRNSSNSPTKEKDYSKLFYVARQNLYQSDYLTKRGISLQTQQNFGCGYMPNFMYKGNQSTPAIIIPTSNSSFMWRSTTENIKQKRGTVHILNPHALKNDYCFVVEGEIDCMSIVECGFACIGLGSTSNIKKIFEYTPLNAVLIIAMDSDRAGIKATRQLETLCIENKVPYIAIPDDMWVTKQLR